MQQTFATPQPIRVDISVPSGSVEVDAADVEETFVEVDASEELLQRTIVELRGDELRVEVRNRDGFFVSFTRESIRVRVRCPRESSLSVSSKSADVVAHGTLGDVRVRTASGDIAVDTVGALDVQSASGDAIAGTVRGRASIQVVSGDVRVRDAAGPIRAQSVSGDVSIDRVTGDEARFESVSGDIEVGIARGSRVHVDAFTLSGDTRSELELGGAHETGEDGPLVDLRAKTVSGDIAVVRAAAPTPQEV